MSEIIAETKERTFTLNFGPQLPRRKHMLAAISAIIGTLDIVFGEIDR